MKSINKLSGAFLTLAAFFVLFNLSTASAQCGAFAKKKCLPTLSPFTHNGQLNSTTLAAGETAELAMTFYSGQNYRLLVCAAPQLEGVYFKIKDADHKELYNSKDKNDNHFDFNIKSTQLMYIEVVVPDNKKGAGDIADTGCVSVLVGFKN